MEKDKEVLQAGRRKALFSIGGILIFSVSCSLRGLAATYLSKHPVAQDEFIVVGNWVMLKQDLL